MSHDHTTAPAFPASAPRTAATPATPATPAAAGRGRAAGPLLATATVAMGLMAGLFFAFDVSVMPGLAKGDDRTYVTAMQNINKAIENGLFGLVFVGAFAVTGAAAYFLYRAGHRTTALWAGAATLLYVAALVVTMGVNIPLNNELAQAGDPSQIADFAAVRTRFESTWVATNMLRTAFCTAGLAALIRALLLHARAQR
ncbi:DUF1772 domain-containing protein [Kitasatospora sp. NPDC056181]|uniref:anthrone oxygenase family protein n=1 Tax=Kitasatospora sp. NPDC056181 TaxID=3345737 RepID=UPI0035DA6524